MNKHSDVVIKTGVLFKKGAGGGLLKRQNWKPRYFVLTPTVLRYYTCEGGELKGEIHIKMCGENALEIMPTDSMKTGASASTVWRIAINSPNRRLLMAASNEREMNEWIDAVLSVFRANITGSSHVQKSGTIITPQDMPLAFSTMPTKRMSRPHDQHRRYAHDSDVMHPSSSNAIDSKANASVLSACHSSHAPHEDAALSMLEERASPGAIPPPAAPAPPVVPPATVDSLNQVRKISNPNPPQ
jgi:hypothetical protein